jgi:hypothetical protein
MGNQVQKVLFVLGWAMVGRKDGDWNLAKLFEIHDTLLVLLFAVSLETINVELIKKEIVSIYSIRFFGIDSKNKVNPSVKSLSDVLPLKELPHPRDKLIFILGPSRQHNVVDDVFVLPRAKVIFISVL